MVDACTVGKADLMFQGKHADEAYHFHFHQHWIRMVWPFCKLLVYTVIIFAIGYGIFVIGGIQEVLTRRLILSALCLFFLVAQFEFLIRFYRYLLYVIVATDKKIHRIKKSLLLIDEHQTLDLWMLQDVFKTQHGLIQNLFGYGSIVLEAQDTVLRIHFAPRVQETSVQILHLRELARMQMANFAAFTKQRNKPSDPSLIRVESMDNTQVAPISSSLQ